MDKNIVALVALAGDEQRADAARLTHTFPPTHLSSCVTATFSTEVSGGERGARGVSGLHDA